MERSFKAEVAKLKLGEGETFHGEGILAVTKALLQSGVGYVGGYQGAPVSHMMDVLNDAREILDELGIHVEANANEAGAAAMLGASINYPVRGAVTFKSTVGTNVAADALSNIASAGVKGGALIVLGEDYGEGSSIIQERSHAFAMKSQIWLLDRKSTRLNSSHTVISYAVFCLKKKTNYVHDRGSIRANPALTLQLTVHAFRTSRGCPCRLCTEPATRMAQASYWLAGSSLSRHM